jgi:hypothetical protein
MGSHFSTATKLGLIQLINSESFKTCEMSKAIALDLISKCEEFNLKAEIEIVKSRMISTPVLSRQFNSVNH